LRGSRFSRLTAFHAALGTKLKILLLFTSPNSLSGFLAGFAGFLAAFFFAELGYREADLADVFRVEHGSVRPHQQADLSCQDARLDILDSFKNLIKKLFPAYFQSISLLMVRRRTRTNARPII